MGDLSEAKVDEGIQIVLVDPNAFSLDTKPETIPPLESLMEKHHYIPVEKIYDGNNRYFLPYESIDPQIVADLYEAAKANDNKTIDDFVNTELNPRKQIELFPTDELIFLREILKYALKKHGTDRRRIGKRILYSRHLIDTARVLLQYDIDHNIGYLEIAGALLHDIVEENKATIVSLKEDLYKIIGNSDISNKGDFSANVEPLGEIVKILTNPLKLYQNFAGKIGDEGKFISVDDIYRTLKEEIIIDELKDIVEHLREIRAFGGQLINFRDCLKEEEIDQIEYVLIRKTQDDENIYDGNIFIRRIIEGQDRRPKRVKEADRIAQSSKREMGIYGDNGDILSFRGSFFCKAADKNRRCVDYANEDINENMTEENYDGTYILLKNQLAKISMENVTGAPIKRLLIDSSLRRKAKEIDKQIEDDKNSGRLYKIIHPAIEEVTENDIVVIVYDPALRGSKDFVREADQDESKLYRHLKLNHEIMLWFLDDFVIDTLTGRLKYNDLHRIDKSAYAKAPLNGLYNH